MYNFSYSWLMGEVYIDSWLMGEVYIERQVSAEASVEAFGSVCESFHGSSHTFHGKTSSAGDRSLFHTGSQTGAAYHSTRQV